MCDCVYYDVKRDVCELPITKGCAEWNNIYHEVKPKVIARSIPDYMDEQKLCEECPRKSNHCRLGPGHICLRINEIRV